MTPTEARIEYLKEHYGQCNLKKCVCLTTGWMGTACPNWVPGDVDAMLPYMGLKDDKTKE